MLPSYSYHNNNKMQLRSLTTRKRRVSMMTRTSLVLLLVLLVLSDNADAARKLPKRPAKPLKTFPRNNASPSIAAAPAAESAAPPPPPTETAEATQTASGSELPKPLTPHASKQPAEAALAEPGQTPVNGESKSDDLNATTAPQGSQIEPEDCEPDMIGFELTTG